MAMLAQFLGAEEVASMSEVQIERTCELLHAEMLKHSLADAKTKESLTRLASGVARKAAALTRP